MLAISLNRNPLNPYFGDQMYGRVRHCFNQIAKRFEFVLETGVSVDMWTILPVSLGRCIKQAHWSYSSHTFYGGRRGIFTSMPI